MVYKVEDEDLVEIPINYQCGGRFIHSKNILTIWTMEDNQFVKGKERFFYNTDFGDLVQFS